MPAGAGLWRSTVELFRNISLAVRRYFYFQDALDELRSCSDRQLADIGLRRGDLVGLAYQMAEERIAAGAARRAPAPAVFGRISVLEPAS